MEQQYQYFLIFVFPYSVFPPFSRFSFDVFPVIHVLYFNYAEFVIASALSLIVGGTLSLRAGF